MKPTLMTDAEIYEQDIPLKRRRLSGACDQCRKRKIKCDSATRPNQRCTNCIAFDAECTHAAPPKKRGPKSAYVEGLEERVKELEKLLEAAQACNQNPPSGPSALPPSATASASPTGMIHSSSSDSSSPGQTSSTNDDETDDLEHVDLVQQMERLSMYNSPRFFGSSSMFAMANNVLRMKTAILGDEPAPERGPPQFWYLQPWEQETADHQTQLYIFPPHDLMMTLIALYFEYIGPFIPILHKPTFLYLVGTAEHLRNQQFGATLLIVLAIASRYTDDPRVLADVYGSKLSSGWKYFEQVTLQKNAVWDIASLYELQAYALSVVYAQGTSVPQTSWSLLGIGLRYAIEIGVHRRKPEGYKPTADDELKKRAFWCMLCLDRMISIFLGRPSLVRDEDFDLELPVECDDEYWDISADGGVFFRQPQDVPSRLAFFTRHIKLCEVLSFVSRTLYCIKKSKLPHEFSGKGWEESIVSHLDMTMKSIMEEMPSHLRWSPHREDSIFMRQSVSLHSLFYVTTIKIHRPFVHTSAASLTACTSAARLCTRVIEKCPIPFFYIPVVMILPFAAGVTLAMSMWSGNGRGYEREIQICLDTLKQGSERWNPCGRFWSTLNEVASGLQQISNPSGPTRKRPRENPPPDSIPNPSTDHWENYIGPLDKLGLDTEFMKTIDMWASAPSGYNPNEWGTYINSMSTGQHA